MIFEADAINKLNLSEIPFSNSDFNILWTSAVNKNNTDVFATHFHSHTFFELHILTDGYMSYGYRDTVKTARGNEFLIIPPGISHKVADYSGQLERLTVAFECPNNICTEFKILSFSNKILTVSSEMYRFLESINSTVKSKNAFSSEIVLLNLQSLLYCIFSEFCEKRHKRITEVLCDDRVTKAKKYIDDNTDIFFSCEQVANYCHISTKHLNRLFRKYENMSLLEYIHSKKIISSQKMLLNTEKTQETISLELGFSGVHYFSKFFAKKVGMTPDNYRRKLKNSQRNSE